MAITKQLEPFAFFLSDVKASFDGMQFFLHDSLLNMQANT